MSSTTFSYTSLPPGHIRLLRRNRWAPGHTYLLSSYEEDYYELVTFRSSDCPAYEAISYCWGTEALDGQCFVNMHVDGGGVLSITPHLREGLRRAFAVFESQWLWVDAVCITQDDNIEKQQQVARMGRLFENAERVIVWLGADYEGSEAVMDLMPLLSSPEVLGLLKVSSRIDWAALQALGVPGCEDPLWISLVDLLHRPWFERLWIVQEAVLAKEAVFLCGNRTVSWDRMRDLCSALEDGDLRRELGEKSLAWRAEKTKYRNFRALGVLGWVEDIKTLRPQRPWVAALILLALVRKQTSNEPLDYVYGILGLLPDSCRGKVIIDYSETSRKYYGRTYAQLFQCLLEGMGDAALTFLNNIETPRGAPSWCPELRSKTQPGYTSFRVPSIGAGCNPSQDGYQTPDIASFGIESADTISVKGAVVDSIAKVVPLVRPGKLWFYPLQYNDEDIASTCMAFHRCKFAAKELNIPLSALARTLTGQTTKSVTEESRFASALDKTSRAFQKLSEHAVPLDAPALEPLLSDGEVVTYTKLLWSHWNGRSFYTTKSGRIGLGLRTAKPGDSICIFFGAPKPYVMRRGASTPAAAPGKQGGDGTAMYKMIAECYVDGIMDGELFRQNDFEEEAVTFYIN